MISHPNNLELRALPPFSIKQSLIEPCANAFHTYIWQPAAALPGTILSGGKRGARWLAGTIADNTPQCVKQCLSTTRRVANGCHSLTVDHISRSGAVRKQLAQLIKHRNDRVPYQQALRECIPLATMLWRAIDLPASCGNQQNLNIFVKTVQNIVINASFDLEETLKIIQNVCTNLENNMQTALQNIERDIQTDPDFRSKFNISPNDKLLKITLLGEETHRGGRRPLQLVIGSASDPTSQRTIVFKQRSMLPEQLIAGREGSICSITGVGGVYTVHDKGEYGYAEWINHSWEENLCQECEIDSYLDQYIALDQLMNRVNVTDLHSLNIITKDKVPYMIDLEVMDPTAKESQLARRVAVAYPGYMPIFGDDGITPISQNVISVQGANGQEFFIDDSNQMKTRLQIEEKSHAIADRLEPYLEQIDSLRSRLYDYPKHRFVPIMTSELNNLINDYSSRTCEWFLNSFQDFLTMSHCEIVPVDPKAVASRLYRDTMNHDIPAFHINMNSGEIFYDDLLIGKAPSNPPKTSNE